MAFSTLILAAGAGTRMKSERPKVAHEVLGKPLVRWVVDVAREAGSEQIFTIVGHQREQVLPLVEDTISIVQEERLGTGHALMVAQETLERAGAVAPGASLVVLAGDAPLLTAQTIAALVAAQQEQQTDDNGDAKAARPVLSVLTFHAEDPTGYGRIVRDVRDDASGTGGTDTADTADTVGTTKTADTADTAATVATAGVACDPQARVLRIVEEKDASPAERALTECNSGAYCFDAVWLFANLSRLSKNNVQGEYYLTDLLALAVADGLAVAAHLTSEAETRGINSREQLAQATKVMQRRINQAHMEAGVTMLDPEFVWIAPEVFLAADVELLPLTMLWGETSVGAGSVIGPNTRITNATIGRACRVEESILEGATLEDEVAVGPRAYLRPGTIMETGSKAGTHVEIKNSTIGRDSKVPHLSYLGDASLGEDVNIGAGSITCNYDGSVKNPTVIGDRAFIGSDTMLVAPVTLGSDTVTGAGSVITHDVPDGALALERTKQLIKENWTAHHTKEKPHG